MISFIYLIVALVLNACANILLKIGATSSATQIPTTFTEYLMTYKFFLIGVVVFACNLLFYFLAIRALPISVAYPVMVGGGFLIINTYAFMFLHERISTIQIIGCACIVFGIMLVISFARNASA